MEDFNAKQSSEDVEKLITQLRAENAALRDELAAAEAARAHAQAELSTLTDAAQVLQEDREQLRNKIAELQAAVDRLTNMLWGRRSEKRSNSNQPTLFELQVTDEELTAEQQKILAAEDLLSAAAKQKLRLQHHRRRVVDEAELPSTDVSATRHFRPRRILPQPLDVERLVQLLGDRYRAVV